MNYLQIRRSFLGLVPILAFAATTAQAQTISGVVKSAIDNEPFPGVTVQVKGTQTGTSTDLAGKYTISKAASHDTLVFSAAGFITQEIPVGGKAEINLVLVQDKAGLQEVIVTGYRTQTRGSVTGSVTALDGSELKNAPYDNLSNALAGRLSGVTVNQAAGSPGMESSIKIRAVGTFNNSDPLYVIDGVVTDKFAFDGLNPSAVESITILKDGASAAIYGSRAANGVVLVTTKRGKEGPPLLTYSGLYGIQTPTKIPTTLNAYQQAKAINDALAYNNTDPADNRYYTSDELDYFKTHSWDWVKALWQDPATTQHSLSVSGGTPFVKYFLDGSYNYATGSFNNLDYRKFTLTGNVDVSVTKDLKLSLNLSTDKRKTNGPSWDVGDWRQEDLYKALMLRSGMVPPYINGMPVGNWVEWHPGVVIDPAKAGYDRREWTDVNATMMLNYDLPFVKGLSAKVSLNEFKRNIYEKQFNLPYDMVLFNTTGDHNHIVGDQPVGIRHRSANEFLLSRYDKIERYQFDGQINYKRTFGDHHIDALVVYEQAEEDDIWFNGRRDNFISPNIDQYIAGSPVDPHVDGSETQTARISYVGLASYNYKGKYLLDASFRYDGSVIFAPGKRWGFFPSVSAGWRISDEPFFQKHVRFINDLKLRASVGVLGNDDVGSFQWVQAYNIVDGAIFNDATVGLEQGTLANKDITWEKSRSYNAGFDSHFWNSKMSLKLDLFYRHTYDILGSRQQIIPSTFGAVLPDENYEQVNARGFEVELGYENTTGNARVPVSYYIRGNFGLAVNKVMQLDQAENIRPYQSKIGLPVNPVFGYVATGIIRTQKDLDALPAGYTINGVAAELGMMNYKDIRGPNSDQPDGRITSDDQEYIAKYSTPRMNFGMSLGATWRSFSIDVLLQGVAGGKEMMHTNGRDIQARVEESSFGYWADSWTPDNPNGKYPGYRGTSYRTRYPVSTFWLMDLSFLRVKNLSVSYSLPQAVINRLHAHAAKLFFTGTNLFMLYSGNKIYDPEVNNIRAYPLMETYSFGVNIGL